MFGRIVGMISMIGFGVGLTGFVMLLKSMYDGSVSFLIGTVVFWVVEFRSVLL
jgi:hypothetical protein